MGVLVEDAGGFDWAANFGTCELFGGFEGVAAADG